MANHTDRGEKLFDISAVPAKDVLRNKARVCPPIPAICEILDNIFDNYEENGAKDDLAISFVIREQEGLLSIRENSGGIKKAKLEPLVRLGVHYGGARGSIGTWGEGFKVAAFSLGAEVEVRTQYPGDTPVSVHFPSSWINSNDWSVPVYALKANVPKPGTTEFIIRWLTRPVNWTEVMHEVAVIYGHRIKDVEEQGRHVKIDFDIDGARARLKPRPLATTEALRARFAFPPNFAPRVFTTKWKGEHGGVKARIIIGLTARHSADTSGVYVYGNGRLFARALRTKPVGYNEGPRSTLRDHPTFWRFHAYVFLEADNGADIPWQAPLKDGISENHPITEKLRETLKITAAPYAKFAKVAKASELVPYTAEWADMSERDRAEMLFGDETNGIQRFRALPSEIKNFAPPSTIESVAIEGITGERVISQLGEHVQYARAVIAKRDTLGTQVQENVLRSLNPNAFSHGVPSKAATKNGSPKPVVIRTPRVTKLSIKYRDVDLQRLRKLFETEDNEAAIHAAIAFAMRELAKKAKSPQVRRKA